MDDRTLAALEAVSISLDRIDSNLGLVAEALVSMADTADYQHKLSERDLRRAVWQKLDDTDRRIIKEVETVGTCTPMPSESYLLGLAESALQMGIAVEVVQYTGQGYEHVTAHVMRRLN